MDEPNSAEIGCRAVTIRGEAYADPVNNERYLVKVYPIPDKSDLRAHIPLIESFERRFLHTAEGGMQMLRHGDLDAFIDKYKKAYAGKNGGEQDVIGGQLCIALLERGIRRAKEHIMLRIEKPDTDAKLLSDMARVVEADLMEAIGLFGHVRRHRGHTDVDAVLNEMKGEPYNIFAATLPGSDGLAFFRRNRLLKAARAMECVDNVAQSLAGLAASHKLLVADQVPGKLKELAEAAKHRLQLQWDDPAFASADLRLRLAHNALLTVLERKMKVENADTAPAANDAYGGQPAHLPADYGMRNQVSPTSKALLREGADIIHDIAIVRVPRTVSAKDLEQRVEEHRGHSGPMRKTAS